MKKIHGNGSAPFRFLTPSPHQFIQRIYEGQWMKKPFEGKAGMVHEVGTVPIL